MLELMVLGAVVTFGALAVAGVAVALVFTKLMLWLVLLPFRLLLWLVLIPVLLFKTLFGLVFGAAVTLLLAPVVGLILLASFVGAAAALALPALLVLIAGMGLIWLFRSPAQPVPAR
ncbi:MAG: hypothetical protein QF463_00190 [Vicinamibacterales bacterium]|jgi:hypothetical protein|nr:hypothetical protein [Acidobacteriota bacterium]MDP6370961.1 hypothetical protein [Vicinamibacterales bacterium]MDP6607471.1 hypothetical protein [Vicinamibacterales bacterium]HAK55385.1 hypothetical protein [Acidobacteriota bacterium]|tara:strand:+ start:1184 stop:1534 length:351 start_codon:yes stop_codon:yes gene_type:complete